MTPQEQQMLQSLTDRVNRTPLTEKDPQAEQYLHDTLGRNPDALYILAQTTLVQGYALEQAQKQMADLKQQVSQAQQHVEPKHTSFLGNLLGLSDEPTQPAPPPPSPMQSQQYRPVQQQPQQYAQAPQYAQQPGMVSGGMGSGGLMGGGSFLGSAMRTAAGVAAGALAFQGIESLMHGFGGGGGFGGSQGLGGFGGQPREEITNNYYGDQGANNPGGQSSDIEDRRDDSSRDNFSDSSNSLPDDSSMTDTSADDSASNFDDSGSSDFSSNDSGDSGSSDDSSF